MDTLDRMLAIQFAININEEITTVNWLNQRLKVMERVALLSLREPLPSLLHALFHRGE
jgi:hypothetical protein